MGEKDDVYSILIQPRPREEVPVAGGMIRRFTMMGELGGWWFWTGVEGGTGVLKFRFYPRQWFSGLPESVGLPEKRNFKRRRWVSRMTLAAGWDVSPPQPDVTVIG